MNEYWEYQVVIVDGVDDHVQVVETTLMSDDDDAALDLTRYSVAKRLGHEPGRYRATLVRKQRI